MLFVHPSHDFIREHKTSIKIEIDNNLSLGWKKEDIIFATNFPFEYRGVKSILVSSDCYNAEISPCASIIFVIVDLFQRNLIQKNELYWYHDTDLYQLYEVTESEINLGKADMGVVDWGNKISASSFFFKSSAKDIFISTKEIMYKYLVDEEVAIKKLLTDNKNVEKRVKKLNITYDFEPGYLNQFYHLATKPIKVAHFHFTKDRLLDSAMYGKNSIKKPLMPERLIKIFHKHGVKGTALKKMKNLITYINPLEKFLGGEEILVKRQIDNSLKLGWKKEAIIFVTNFPYEYNGVKSIVMNDINDKAINADIIFHLLSEDKVHEAELWWYHDLDVFQTLPIDSSEVDLEDTTAGFMDISNFFFRKDSNKLFEWMRNRAHRLKSGEAQALESLAALNYRNINALYKKIKLDKYFD